MIKPASTAEFYSHLESFQASFNSMQPELEVSVRDPELAVEGHVVVWNTAISKNGPLSLCGKGGTRIREGLSLDEVRMLARTMAIKNAAAGLPLGGAKSGLNADPKLPGFEVKYRRFVELCKPLLHENGGIFGGFGFDVGASPEHAIWACDTLGSTRSFTGKSVQMGGTDYDKEGIAGLGVAESAAAIIELQNEDTRKMRFAVHGLGAMGAAVVRYFSEYGAQLVAIGDPKYGGTWHFEAPISSTLKTALVEQQFDEIQRLLRDEGEFVSDQPNEVLYTDVDVLFPCALHSVITERNAASIKSRYLIEGANSPCDTTVFPLLHHKGIYLIPDFIANSGGIVAAYVELTYSIDQQEDVGEITKVEQAKSLTRSKIRENVTRMASCSQQFGVPLRDAGLYIALHKILYGHAAS